MLTFFIMLGFSVELYFVLFHDQMPVRARTELLARGFAWFGTADNTFYDHVTPLAVSFEALNIFAMQPLCAALLYAIVRRRPYRWPLQLGVSAYLSVSVVLYYLVNHLSGYAGMPRHTAGAFALLYGANFPWLAVYGWLAWDAGRVIAARFASAPAIVERDRVATVVEQLGQQAAEVEPGRQPGNYGEGAEPLAP